MTLPMDASAVREGDREAQILALLPEVRVIARGMMRRIAGTVQFEDLVSAGILGLIAAVDKFDPKQQTQLRTYAYYRIRGAMLDSLRSADFASRRIRRKAKAIERAIHQLQNTLGREPEEEEIAASLSLTVDEYRASLSDVQNATLEYFDASLFNEADGATLADRVASSDEDSPARRLERKEAQQILSQAIQNLPPREQHILSLYYQHETAPGEIAEIMKLRPARVSQLKAQGLLRLRSALNSQMFVRT